MEVDEFLWIISFGIGGLAAWQDWKYRQVPNGVWILGLILATPLLLMEAFQSPMEALVRWACAVTFSGLIWLLWRGQAFGGADLKGFALFGLLLSPIGYFSPTTSRFFPALDVLVTALIVGELLRRILKERALPLFTVSLGPLLLVQSVGGIVWWPLVWILRVFVH